MKKIITTALVLSGLIANAQYEKRVGINTDKPRASLEVKAVTVDGRAQGILFPHISETEKNSWIKDNTKGLVAGTVIWNTTKNCVDYFDGTQWQCTDGSKKSEHGDDYTQYRATYPYSGPEEFKKVCSADEYATKVAYTPSSPIVGVGKSNTSQEEAERLAQENAIAEYRKLGQLYADANGQCLPKTSLQEKCSDFENDQYYIDKGYELMVLLNGYTVKVIQPSQFSKYTPYAVAWVHKTDRMDTSLEGDGMYVAFEWRNDDERIYTKRTSEHWNVLSKMNNPFNVEYESLYDTSASAHIPKYRAPYHPPSSMLHAQWGAMDGYFSHIRARKFVNCTLRPYLN